jgi:membrane protease YdiL (CAAX protease family)
MLLLWLILGTVVAFVVEGMQGSISSLVNLCLMGVYAVIIKMMTEGKTPQKHKIDKPVFELTVGLLFLGVMFFSSLLFFQVINVPGISQAYNTFITNLYSAVAELGRIGFPQWSLHPLYNALYCTIVASVPVLLIYCAFGYRLRDMSLTSGFWKLTRTLLGISILIGLPVPELHQKPVLQVLVLYIIQIFINGLPEEFLFRGFLLPRLESVLKNPINALVLTSILFNAAHIPFSIANGTDALPALLGAFSISYPSGLIWGYLYLRTRTIIPGMLWHAANGILGGFLIYLG